MYFLKPNAQRAKNAIILLWLNLSFSAITIITTVWQYSLLLGIRDRPDEIDMPTIELSDQIQTIVTYLNAGVSIITAVFFIMWFRRAYFNLQQLPGSYFRYSEGWAAGAWFVPILNWIRPYQIMREIWDGNQHYVSHRIGGGASNTPVGTWWAFWIVMSLSSNVYFRVAQAANDVQELISISLFGIIVEVISIVAAILAIMMVRKASRIEDEVWDEASSPSDSIFAQNEEVVA